LTGFSPAIEAVFPQTEVPNCIIHQLRNSSKYVSYKEAGTPALDMPTRCCYFVDKAAAADAAPLFQQELGFAVLLE